MWNSILLWFQLNIPLSLKKSKILYLFNVRLSHITLLLTFMLNPMVVWVLFIICLCHVLNVEDFPIQQLKLLLWWLLSVGPRGNLLCPVLSLTKVLSQEPCHTFCLLCLRSWVGVPHPCIVISPQKILTALHWLPHLSLGSHQNRSSGLQHCQRLFGCLLNFSILKSDSQSYYWRSTRKMLWPQLRLSLLCFSGQIFIQF